MDYLFFQLWPMLLLALIMGMVFGYYTCGRKTDRSDR
jgi:hypothetical protein